MLDFVSLSSKWKIRRCKLIMEMSLFQGLLNNVLITIGSCVVPFVIGIAAYFVCSKNESLSKLAHLVGIVFESFCPVITILLMYYCIFGNSRISAIWVCIIGFSISFLGYMPTRYDSDYSFFKNTVVNALGLASSVFKWSFCASFIGTVELLRVANIQMSKTYDASSFWTVLLISFVVIFILELVKYIAKEKL